MLVVGIIFSLGLLGVIIYIAISPKSSKIHRKSAIGALSLIIVSLLISGVLIVIGPSKEDPDAIPLPVFQDSAPEVKRNFRVTDIVIISVLLLFLVVVIAKALKDQKNAPVPALKPAKPLDFTEDVFSDSEKEMPILDDNDSFQIDDIELK